jgi:hypothetical protein
VNPRGRGVCSAHPKVSNKAAAVETIGALKEQYGDRHLAVGRRRQPKKGTQGGGGSQQKLVAARGRLTRSAFPALRKGHGRRRPGKDVVVRGAPKGRTFENRRRERPKSNNGIMD